MNLLSELNKVQRSAQSAYHIYLTRRIRQKNAVHLFFEGDDDESFYLGFVRTKAKDDREIYTYVCGSKDEVFHTYSMISSDSIRVTSLFFVDKDYSDLLAESTPNFHNIFITQYYSIENYLVSEQMLRRIWNEVYHLNLNDAEFEVYRTLFLQRLAEFYDFARSLTAWVIFHRREGKKPNYRNINLDGFCTIDKQGNLSIGQDLRGYMETSCGIKSAVASDAELQTVLEELCRLDPKAYVRGKFELWFFLKFLRHIESRHHLKLNTQIHAANAIEILGPRLEIPKDLDEFLQKNLYKSGPFDLLRKLVTVVFSRTMNKTALNS